MYLRLCQRALSKNFDNNNGHDIAQSVFGKLLETYPERLTSVITARGASTKY